VGQNSMQISGVSGSILDATQQLLNLSRDYPASRLDAACRIANREGLSRLKQIRSVLQSNRDQLPEQIGLAVELPQDHDNIRGPHHFH